MQDKRKVCYAVVEKLDLTGLLEKATRFLQDKVSPEITGAQTLGNFGLIRTEAGWRILNSEGVMSEILRDDEDGICYHIPVYHECDGGFSVVPSCNLYLSLEELLEIPVSELIPVTDFIRSFGHRLENNYRLCATALNNDGVLPPREKNNV